MLLLFKYPRDKHSRMALRLVLIVLNRGRPCAAFKKHIKFEDMDPVELRIEVPYGFLAAKVWGPADGKRVVALHGWLDSAATFDTLCPLLDSSLRIVALDFAGHGNSSHRPPGCRYNILEYVIDVRRVVDHLKWDRFCIVGHSMGGSTAIMFAGLFPDRVLSLITLDVVVPTVIVDSVHRFGDRAWHQQVPEAGTVDEEPFPRVQCG
nr:serine hydrolase-like protein [Rhipicephalus microplus]